MHGDIGVVWEDPECLRDIPAQTGTSWPDPSPEVMSAAQFPLPPPCMGIKENYKIYYKRQCGNSHSSCLCLGKAGRLHMWPDEEPGWIMECPAVAASSRPAPRGAHGQATAEVPGAPREAGVGPPPPPAAPTPWSTSLWSPWGADRGVQGTANSGEGGLASCGAEPHAHSFFQRKNLLHSYVPWLDCSDMLLLAWAPSSKPSGVAVGLGHETSIGPVLSHPTEAHSIYIPHFSLFLPPL